MLRAAALAIVATLLVPTASPAQERCAEGRTLSGACVDAALAANARQIAVLFSQPKISATAFAVMPSADSITRYPASLNGAPSQPSATGTPPPPPPPPVIP